MLLWGAMNVEQGRPSAPEQQDPISNLAQRRNRLSDLVKRRKPLMISLGGMENVVDVLERRQYEVEREMRERLTVEASELVGPELLPLKPITKLQKGLKTSGIELHRKELVLSFKAKEPQPRKEKSRGLKDPRPVEFVLQLPRGKKKEFRGKEGKLMRLLAPWGTLTSDELAGELYPGVKKGNARERVNKTARSVRKFLNRHDMDIVVKRDHEKKTTTYSLRKKGKQPRKKH